MMCEIEVKMSSDAICAKKNQKKHQKAIRIAKKTNKKFNLQ